MYRIVKLIKPPHIISALAVGGFAFAMLNGNGPPLFTNLNDFVLFAQEEARLGKDVQISSGDLGSNGKIDIEKDVIVNGNLFADTITIDKNTTINGNASFNKLKLHKEAQILGTQTKPVQLPIANLPPPPSFSIGVQDFKFIGQDNSLPAGSYRDITVEKNSKLVLTGGTYNISKLILRKNSVLIYSGAAALNIQEELRGQQHVAILPDQNLSPDDLVINYIGKKIKKDKDEKKKCDEDEDDDEEDENEEEAREDAADDKANDDKTVKFGKDSLLNFKILAPKATVRLGDTTTFRGQVLAKKIKVGKESVVSREETVIKESIFEEAILEEDGSRFFVNELIINLKDEATFLDAQNIADQIDGRIVGFIKTTNVYQIEVSVNTPEELETKIQFIRHLNNPLIEVVFRNYIFNIS